MLPDGRGFNVHDAAVLLFDRKPDVEDEASVRGVVEVLERWSVLRSTGRGTTSCMTPIQPSLGEASWSVEMCVDLY